MQGPAPSRVARTYLARQTVVMRPEGWKAQGDEAVEILKRWMRPGYVYRGMTAEEYNATVGRGKPVQSIGRYSLRGEGTNYAADPADAEDYANFGRDDPRTTGRPNYLVEVKVDQSFKRWRDGYWKTPDPQPAVRVWKMYGEDGAVVAQQIK